MIATYLTVIADKTSAPPNLEELAQNINLEHQKCLATPHLALIYGRNAGEYLLAAHAQICEKEWGEWLKTNCTVSEQTAQTYMQIARKFPNLNAQAENQPQQILNTPFLTPLIKVNLAAENQPKINSYPQSPQIQTLEETKVSPSIPQSPQIQTLEETKVSPSIENNNQSIIPAVEEKKTEPSPPPQPKPPEKPVNASEAIIDVEFTPVPTQQAQSSSSQKKPSSQKTIRFCIPGAVVPKARPRVTTNGTYMPHRYREWRNRAEIEIYRQISEHHPKYKFPIRKASISLRFFGNHRTNSDLDNLAGACLDALTLKGAGVLMDDRVSCVPQLNVEFIPNVAETGVWIEIEPIG